MGYHCLLSVSLVATKSLDPAQTVLYVIAEGYCKNGLYASCNFLQIILSLNYS
jgi:hypothetical protein